MNNIERRPLDTIINDMQRSYGLKVDDSNNNSETLIPTDTSDIAVRAREINRIATRKVTQFPAKHPILLFAGYIFTFISNQIYNFFNQGSIRRENEILFLANSLKNHGFINQKQFILFKQANGAEKTILKDIVRELFNAKRIDRKSFVHLTTLAHNNCIKEVLQFLFALSSVSNIHRFNEELKLIVQPKEQLEMLERLKEAYDHSSFPDSSVQAFSTLTARLEICRWVREDTAESIEKTNLLETLKSNNSEVFQKAMVKYLKSKMRLSKRLEKEYYKELIESFKSFKAPNAFIHFSQAIETLSVMKEWENKVEKLEEVLQEMVDAGIVDEERSKAVLKDLKELYTIFGKILENEKESSVTPTAMGHEQGLLRLRWKNIGNLIQKLSGKENHHDHHLCGCLFDIEDHKKAWPDVEIWGGRY